MGEVTFDIGPGAKIWIAAGSWPGMVVSVRVGIGVGLNVGSGVSVGGCVGVKAITVSVAETFAAPAVNAMIVGRYSGGKGVGIGLEVGVAKGEQAAKIPRKDAKKMSLRFITRDRIQQVQHICDSDLLDP